MELRFAVLAEAANVTEAGRVNVLGIFSHINSPQVPFQVPALVLVMQLRATPGEKGTTQRLKVMLVDQDGRPIAHPAEVPVVVPAHLGGPDVEMNTVMSMNGLVFQQFGLYRVDITVNDHSLAQIPFHVNLVPPPDPRDSPMHQHFPQT